jgi:hypothetical protein
MTVDFDYLIDLFGHPIRPSIFAIGGDIAKP